MKRILSAAGAVFTLCCAVSCGNNDGANAMLASIKSEIEAQRFENALNMMDSLDSVYPEATEIRSAALKLRPAAIEGATIHQISSADSVIAATEMTIDSLSACFDYVKNPELVENYYVPKSARGASLMTSTGIQPRVDEEYNFYIICSLTGNNVGIKALTLSIDGNSASTNEIPAGDERSFSSPLGEKAVFSEYDAADLGRLAADKRGSAGTISVRGRKSDKTIKLSAADVQAIADSYLFATAHKSLVLAKIRREKLERQLAIARNQMANISM